MYNRGDRSVLVSIDEETGETELVAMAFLDNHRRMFIGTAFGVGEGDLVERKRDRQDDKSHNAPPNKVIIDVAQPLMIKKYHEGVGAIDGHNSIRTNVLGLDNIATDDWSKRVNLAILGMIMVDAALFYSHIASEQFSTYCQFFGQLADELIDNTVDDHALRFTMNDGSAATSERPVMRKTNRYRISKGKKTRVICRDDVNARVARGRRRVEMEAEILKHRWCVVLVLVMMETIHSSGGYAVVWRDLDAGQSTARICMLILQTCIELYNYMVRYNT
jgi:hypothetical protein